MAREVWNLELKGFRESRAKGRSPFGDNSGSHGKTSWGGKFRLRRALDRSGLRKAGLRPKRSQRGKKPPGKDSWDHTMPMNSAYRNTSS